MYEETGPRKETEGRGLSDSRTILLIAAVGSFAIVRVRGKLGICFSANKSEGVLHLIRPK